MSMHARLLAMFVLLSGTLALAHPEHATPAFEASARRVQSLRDAASTRPDDDRALAALAHATLDLGRRSGDHALLAESGRAFETLVARRPEASEAWVGLTHARIGRHAFASALEAAREAVRLAPDDPSVRSVLGDAHLAIGNYTEAEAIFRWRASDLSLETLSRLALLEQELGRIEDALVTMDEARQAGLLLGASDLEIAWCHTMTGDMLLTLGRLDEATEAYTRAAGLDPEAHAAMFGLARVMHAQGRTEEATRMLERLVERASNPRYRLELVRVTGATGMLDPLREALESEIEGGDLEHARTLVELTLEFGGDERRAAALARRELREVRQDIDAHVVAARALSRVGEHDEGVRLIRIAMGLAPDRPDVRLAGVEVLRASGREVEASILARRLAGPATPESR
ncbi:MAG: tetratricopeptide repeat protein [Phycisphaerales bacterium]|nr:tetratricopeptide repeat protein [Phycisphaerales bacterium]